MPDPARARPTRGQKSKQRADNDAPPTGPLWARAVHVFYDPIFDIRSRAAFQAALNDFVLLPADERAFHETHLLYRLVQGLEGIHGVLQRIEKKLDAVTSPELSALEHLKPIRAALEELANNQPSLVQVDGWADEEDEEDEEDDDDQRDDDRDELADDEDGSDPDFIYDTVPDEQPEEPRRPKRQPRPAAPVREEARADTPRPPRAADPEREALIGELVPATEGPKSGAEADR